MSAILAVAAKDLRQRMRDRSAIVLGFVAPLVIAALMSQAFSRADDFHMTLGYTSADRGAVASALHAVLTSPQLRSTITLKPYADVDAARKATHDHDVAAAVVVPAGFTDAVTSGRRTDVQVLGTTDTRLSTAVTRAVVEAFLARVNADRLAVGASVAAGRPVADAPRLARAAQAAALPVDVVQRNGNGDRELKTISYYAPSMGMFFVLFAIGFGARSWFLERAAGTLDRMAAAPISAAQLLLGKALATFGYAVASLATTVAVSAVAFGAAWGNALAVAILCLAVSVSVVALTMLVMVLARSERQAEGLASILTFALVIAGGNFVLASAAPDALRRVALWTPNGSALRGFTDLATGATGTSTVLTPVANITAFTAAVLVVTLIALRRTADR